ncbi:MAG: glycogen synthase GlgA [Acidobacteria bacterium]|nr:glycogen synthase GlgA [Acidobacteriota bacterium]
MRVLIAASEGVPYSKTGGLADVIGALPQALASNGVQVGVVLPRYKSTRLENSKQLVSSLTVALGDGLRFPSILQGPTTDSVRWFFVDYPPFFDRDSLYVGPSGTDYTDNPERFALFSRTVLEIAKTIFPPHLIHCHDWQAGLVPVMLRTAYASDPALQAVPIIFTVHNLGYQGLFPYDALSRAGLPLDMFRVDRLEFYGKINFLKGALVYSDAITTVSRKYAQEIQTPEYGFGLDGVLRDRAEKIHGILNGVDYSQWDPAVDPHIAAHYDASNLDGKTACKQDLLRQFGLPDDTSIPLIGIVSRFTRQKGFDLIAEVAERLMAENVRLVALGNGEAQYEKLFTTLAARFPERVGVRVAYDDVLAHKIEAGADMFLMPSRYEPCGLNQIYSLRYGTVPVVRATGGLDDTIEDYDASTGVGTGFQFSAFSGIALLETVLRALSVYDNPDEWRHLMRAGMKEDFSWDASAREYAALYRQMAGDRVVPELQSMEPKHVSEKQPAKRAARPSTAVKKSAGPKPASEKKKPPADKKKK